jgi:hypothetical protein
MTDKKIKEAEWLAKHTLTPEQVRQLIQNKLARAKQLQGIMKRREVV